jgi:hypothetical protein
MDVSRRSFLRGALAVTAVAVSQPSLVLASVPTIHGDGIHDDHAGLQALIDGKPFRVADEAGAAFQASSGIIQSGTFAIGETLRLRGEYIRINQCRFLSLPGFKGDHMVNVERGAVGAITKCCFDASHVNGAALRVNR